jgi:hypothetical protein
MAVSTAITSYGLRCHADWLEFHSSQCLHGLFFHPKDGDSMFL